MIFNPTMSGGRESPKVVQGIFSKLSFNASWTVVYMAEQNQYIRAEIKGNEPFSVLANTLLWTTSGEGPSGIEAEGGAERIAYSYTNDGVFWITDDFKITAL